MKFKVTIGKFQNAKAEIKVAGRCVGWLGLAESTKSPHPTYGITLVERFNGARHFENAVSSPAEAKRVLEQAVNAAWERLTKEFAVEQRLRQVESTFQGLEAIYG